MQLIRIPVPFSVATPARTTPNAACDDMVNAGPQQPPYVLATELTTMIEPYAWSFGAAFGYEPFGVVLAMAGGAYFKAKKGAILFASNSLYRSAGVVSDIEGGPSRPEDVT